MKILLDCDGVLSSFTGAYVKLYTQVTGRKARLSDVRTYNIRESLQASDDEQSMIEGAFRSPGFCRSLRVLPGAQSGVKALKRAGHSIVVVTSPYRDCIYWRDERRAWLEAHFYGLIADVVFAHDKSAIAGDMIVDDKIGHVRDWRGTGPRVLWAQPWNSAGCPVATRTRSWADLLRLASGDRLEETPR